MEPSDAVVSRPGGAARRLALGGASLTLANIVVALVIKAVGGPLATSALSTYADMWIYAMGWILGLIFFPFALWCLRAQVVADRHGIRWRGLIMPERTVPWSDVTGCADLPMKNDFGLRIDLKRGKILLSYAFSDLHRLKAFVGSYAGAAPSGEWSAPMETSERIVPRVYTYPQGPAVLMIAGAVIVAALRVAPAALLVRTAPAAQLPMAVAAVILYSGLTAFACWCAYDIRRRRDERILVGPDGIAFEKGGRVAVQSTWDDVRYDQSRQNVVPTLHGTFTLGIGLSDLNLLRGTLQVQALARARDDVRPEPGDSPLPRTFPISTSTDAFNIAALTIGALLLVLMAGFGVHFGLYVLLVVVPALLGCILSYRTSALILDDAQVTLRRPFHAPITLPWSDVSAVGYAPGPNGVRLVIDGRDDRIWVAQGTPRVDEIYTLALQLARARSGP